MVDIDLLHLRECRCTEWAKKQMVLRHDMLLHAASSRYSPSKLL